MATTAESLWDALHWLGRVLLVFLKWAVVVCACIGLVVVAIRLTDRDPFVDCDEVPVEQRTLLDSFRQPAPERSFQVVSDPICWPDAVAASVGGLDGPIEPVIEGLAAEGWQPEVNLWPIEYDLRVVCFRSDDGRLAQVELSVSSSRAGVFARAELRVIGEPTACRPFTCTSLSTGCERWDRLEAPM